MMNRTETYWLAGLLGLVGAVLVYSLGLRSFAFTVPFSYQSDALQYLAVLRTVLDTGWYTETQALGAPFGAMHYDAPVPDGLFLLFVAALSPFTSNPAIAFNLLFIGGFFLVAASFYYSARTLDISRPLAAAGALAYTFLPFHFLRVSHLFHTLYFLPPLVVAVAARLADPVVPAVAQWLTWRKVLLFVATGAAGAYNAFFLSLLMGFTAAAGAIARREPRRLAHGAAAIGIIAFVLLLNLVPTLVHRALAGPNPEAVQRSVGESEVYGLKLAQVVLPHAAHPLPGVGKPAQTYGAATFVTENHTAALGLIGSVGFLLALFWLLLRPGVSGDMTMTRIELLSKANGFLFLVAAVGGLGVFFAMLVTPQLRAWNRVSVVIGAIALFVLLLALMRWISTATSERARTRRTIAAAAVLLLVWAVDQAPQRVRQSPQDRDDHAADADFIAQAAAAMPAGSLILQLPYTSYPEAPAHFQEGHYGMLRPYLHPSRLRWSHGGMRGRPGDLWLRTLSTKPIAEQLAIAAQNGFSGVYVERRAYKDRGAQVEREIAALLGPPVVERRDGALSMYRMTPTGPPPKAPPPAAPSISAAPAKPSATPESAKPPASKEPAQAPANPGAPPGAFPPLQLGDGFYGWEREGSNVWSWSRGDASLVATNPRPGPVKVVFKFWIETLAERTVRVSAAGSQPLQVALKKGEGKAIELPVTLAAGASRISFTTSEPAVAPGTADRRTLAFMVRNPRIETP